MRILLALLVVAILFVPILAVFAPEVLWDFWRMIPWQTRRSWAGALFWTIAALLFARIFRAGEADDPPPSPTSADLPERFGRWMPWATAFLAALIAVPLLRDLDGLPRGDWEYYAAKYEAGRISILEYGQFPWWDPWTRGGFPLAANPLYGVFSTATPFVLACGTTIGLRLSVAVNAILAAEGARRLARLWLGDPLASAAVGLMYAINGGAMIAAVAAYDIPMGYAVLPWMLLCVFRLEENGTRAGVWLGFWGAFNLLNGIAYFTIYSVVIAGVVWLRMVRIRSGELRRNVLTNSALALGVALLLAGWRLGVTGALAADYPRVQFPNMPHTLPHLVRAIFARPDHDRLMSTPTPFFWESAWYLGPIVPTLAVLGLRKGWRWWHTLAFIGTMLSIRGDFWTSASYWIAELPIFSSLYVVSRWRFMATLGFTLAAGSCLAGLLADHRRSLRALGVCLVVAVVVDYEAYAFDILPVAFADPKGPDSDYGPPRPHGSIVHLLQGEDFSTTRRGYGLVRGYEPILGYDRAAKTLRLHRDQPEYRGEHWTDEGPVAPVFWSPNRIVFKVKPGQSVHVNQNPGSWWRADGAIPPGWGKYRCAETLKEFVVAADAHGDLVLTVEPKGLRRGLILHAVGLGLVLAALALRRRFSPGRSTLPA